MDAKKILIVDDEKNFVDVLKTRLESTGYQVVSAGDGDEGVTKAREEKPDLILLDVMMPKIDGYTALKLLKDDKATKDIPVLILTCKEKMGDLFTAEGVRGYIVKPYDREHLLTTIKQIIE